MRITFPAVLALAILAAGPLLAQQQCTVARGAVPDCMVGDWGGTSDMGEKLDLFLARLPPQVAASMHPEIMGGLFLGIDSDGWFATNSFETEAVATFMFEDSGSEPLTTTLATQGGTGFFTAGPGDNLAFCSQSGGGGLVTMEGGGERASTPLAPPSGTVVPMRYSCRPGALTLYVDLPDPIGTVTYSMVPIPDSRIEELDAILPARP